MDNAENALRLRNIRKEDALAILRWRNNPQARRNSFHTRPIPWQEHKEWFSSKINSSATKMYLAVLKNSKVGTIRFDVEDELVRVSVNLNPRFFGRGLGSKIIKLGTGRFLNTTKADKPIIAEIKKGNIASEKAFAKALYRLKRAGRKIVVYQR